MQETRQKILQILYEKQAFDAIGAIDIEKIAELTGKTWEGLRSEVKYLEEKGFIVNRRRDIGIRIFRSLYLSAKGVDYFEGEVLARDIREQSPFQSIEIRIFPPIEPNVYSSELSVPGWRNFTGAKFKIDPIQLRILESDPLEYGRTLGKALFSEEGLGGAFHVQYLV